MKARIKRLIGGYGSSTAQVLEDPKPEIDRLRGLLDDVQFFPDSSGLACVSISLPEGHEVYPVRSPSFRGFLLRSFRQEYGGATPRNHNIRFLLREIEDSLAYGLHRSRPFHFRHAVFGFRAGPSVPEPEKIVLDLVQPSGEILAITADGVTMEPGDGVCFHRHPKALPLPKPEPITTDPTGTTATLADALETVIRPASPGDRHSLIAWLFACLHPSGPHPILALHGAPGSGKSTAARILRSFLDPNLEPVTQFPPTSAHLKRAALENFVFLFDNVQRLSAGRAATLAELSSTHGRPAIVVFENGLPLNAAFLHRALTVELSPAEHPLPESHLYEPAERIAPRILGLLANAASHALRNLAGTPPPVTARLPEAAHWALAARESFGLTESGLRLAFASKQLAENKRTQPSDLHDAKTSPTPDKLPNIDSVRRKGTLMSDRAAKSTLPAACLCLIASLLLLLPVATSLRAQTPNRDIQYSQSLVTQPGGTPEERLWQVLVLFGVGDSQPSEWTGNVSATAGDIHAIDGYRLELPGDRVLPEGGWQLATKLERVLFRKQIGARREELLLPKGFLIRGAGSEVTRVSIETNAGAFSFQPMTMPIGDTAKSLDGHAEVRRIIPATDLSGTRLRHHDFPSIGASPDGTLWTTWMSYHDRREELNFRRYKGNQWTRLIPVPRAAEDLWRPHVTTGEDGVPWLIWSEQSDGNWDLYAMPWENARWGRRVRLTRDPLPDIEPAIARATDGTVYVAWQAMRGRVSQIRLKYLKAGRWSETLNVTESSRNEWEPAIAAGPNGTLWIVWDRYTTSYDVLCRSYTPAAGFGEIRSVAATKRFEAHPSVTVDQRNRPWIAWERGDVNWGKDLGYALGDQSPGTPLGRGREIEVAVLDNNVWKAPAKPLFEDSLAVGVSDTGVPELFTDPGGNIWMGIRRCYGREGYRPMAHWESFLTRLEGDHWTDPVLLPHSLTRRSVRMGLTAANGRLWAFWPSENREWDFTSRPFENRVFAGSMELPGSGPAPVLSAFAPDPDPAPAGHPDEPGDVARARAHRIKYGNTPLQILRGDLHRHTELSPDSNIDEGTIIEFYRYMIDAADMDFGASTDHQGGGHDYWNTMTQKLADMYYFPERFTPLYAYERNPGNPHGHRNIIHLTRDYPIVPFFQNIDPRFMLPDTPDGELLTFNSNSFGSTINNDTRLLLDSVKESGGIAIPHTSGTSTMGTDWHASDPEVDMVVEIYQGDRMNYEHRNAPRGIQDGEEDKSPGGYQEPGLVWNAWNKGYRLGVIASSDHFSTHISYAMVYAPGTLREQVFESIKQRHTYGATDNIILEFWMGDHMMGDEFEASERQKVRVKAIGTGEIAAVRLIRDGQFLYQAEPGQREVSLEYVDTDTAPGRHWYYVRIEQANGEIAWSSPIWVTYPEAAP